MVTPPLPWAAYANASHHSFGEEIFLASKLNTFPWHSLRPSSLFLTTCPFTLVPLYLYISVYILLTRLTLRSLQAACSTRQVLMRRERVFRGWKKSDAFATRSREAFSYALMLSQRESRPKINFARILSHIVSSTPPTTFNIPLYVFCKLLAVL